MQKKYLFFTLMLSCVVQMTIHAGQNGAGEDPFAQLPAHLRKFRNDPDNALYADAMKDGIQAIEKKCKKKMADIDAEERKLKEEVCYYRGWYSYMEPEHTLVGQADKKIREEQNKKREDHNKLADVYIEYSNYLHNELSKDTFEGRIRSFESMETALRKCELGDNECYRLLGAPYTYDEMVNQHFRDKVQAEHVAAALKTAHKKGIPITGDELQFILQQNKQYNEAVTKIAMLNAAIHEYSPERIKEREEKEREEQEREKNIKELEAKKAKEEEEKKQALKNELQQANIPVDSDKDDNK
jgi:hypothetical protein